MDEDLSICISCAFSKICCELNKGIEPVAYECEAYTPKEEKSERVLLPELQSYV
jgi:hypothetical protein